MPLRRRARPGQSGVDGGERREEFLSIPADFGGETLGIAVITESAYERRFSDEELALARALGEQASVAIHNARLYEKSAACTSAI